MRKISKTKVSFILFLTFAFIALLPIFSIATTNEIKTIQKAEKEYIIYVDSLLNEKYEFAFSNKSNVEDKSKLEFNKSALDNTNGSTNVAYVNAELYEKYFAEKDNTYIWIKQGEEFKLSAKELDLKDAITIEHIELLKNLTKKIKVSVGEKTLPKEVVDDVEVSRKIGTLQIEEKKGKYSYIAIKAEKNSKQEGLIKLANELNNIDNSNVFEALKTYEEFIDIYNELKPEIKDKKWKSVKDYTIEQPENSKDGEQYLVWIKSEDTIDLQIMTCKDEYEPEYEKQENIIVDIIEVVKTGDNIIIIAAIGVVSLLVLIVAIIMFKKKSKNN